MKGSVATRVALLFVVAYFLVYLFPFPLDRIPGTEAVFKPLYEAQTALSRWVAVHVLSMTEPVHYPVNGSGDTTEAYVSLLWTAAFAVVIALVLVPLTRAEALPGMHQALRLLLRYYLGWTMLSYGYAKVFKLQFPFPGPMRLTEAYGDSSPMGLMWTFMGYSTPYTMFAGAMEVAGGMLIFFRRTTTLGALLLCGVLGNVVMMNLSYDVPVKLYSSHLLLMAAVLALPDVRRLANLLLLNRPAEAVPEARPSLRRRALQLLFIGYASYVEISGSLEQRAQWGDDVPLPPHHGYYEVEALVSDRPMPRLLALSFENQTLGVRGEDRFQERYMLADDVAKATFTIRDRFEPTRLLGVLGYAPQPDARMLVVGSFDGAVVTARLRKVDLSRSLLRNRGFHWINEKPFNH